MKLREVMRGAADGAEAISDLRLDVDPSVILSLLGPGLRGIFWKKAKRGDSVDIRVHNRAHFDWTYEGGGSELARLYGIAKRSQWDAETALDWSVDVDPFDEERALFPDRMLPLHDFPAFQALPRKRQLEQKHALVSWILSQFLHGEQGALFAAAQVTQAVDSMDGKLYGSTQVMDEGRHVEVFHRYLSTKLCKQYPVNDNLYVILDALISDGRWDVKFLGMQILVEGLALGAFGTIRVATREPLLADLLKYVITDEARHVHYGVVALRDYYREALPERARRAREDWAFEICVLMRNRFLAHEFYEEYWAHAMRRSEWNRLVMASEFMDLFRRTMFKRIVPNLKRIGLLTDRIRGHYEQIGLLQYEHGKAAPDLTPEDLLGDTL